MRNIAHDDSPNRHGKLNVVGLSSANRLKLAKMITSQNTQDGDEGSGNGVVGFGKEQEASLRQGH